jgi:hypothetical protein
MHDRPPAGSWSSSSLRLRPKGSIRRWLILEIFAAITVILLTDQLLSRMLTALRPADQQLFVESRQALPSGDPPDILVLGDSNIADAYVPAIVQEQTGWTSFNFGVYGSGPIEWEILTRDLLARWERPPRLAVIGTSAAMFHRATSGGRYTPELVSDALRRIELLRYSGLAEDWFLVLASYRQRYLVPALLRRLSGGPAPAPIRLVEAVDRGYLKNVKHMDRDEPFKEGSYRDRINPQQRNAFSRLLDLLAARGVTVVIADPPLEQRRVRIVLATSSYEEFERALNRVLVGRGVRRFDFRQSEAARQLDYRDFLDAEHVCASGAAYFSTFIAAWISETEESGRPVDARARASRDANACRASQAAAAG